MSRNLRHQIDQHSIISFDIFDTLLKRDVYMPSDVFEIVEREYNRTAGGTYAFREERIKAEKAVRAAGIYDEITLDEIYERIPASDRDALKALELEAESSVLHANPAMRSVYDYCVRKGKTIYIISDMYLPAGFLEDILKREGFSGYRKLFLSADYRKTKRSGKLFKAFIEEEKADPPQVLHIGDSRYADLLGPGRAGIRGVHIDRHEKRTLYLPVPGEQSSLEERVLYAFINTRTGTCKNRGEQLGFEVLGPVIDSFCKWIHAEYEDRKTEHSRLWFLARDMYLFAEAYRLIYGDDADFEYVFVSRKSLRPVLTQAAGDMTEAGQAYARGQYTLREILYKMGYDESDLDAYTEDDLNERCDIRHLAGSETARRLLHAEKIMAKEKELAGPGEAYLKEHGLFSDDILLADVGWHGTTQYILSRIRKAKSADGSIYGLYLGSLDSTAEKLGSNFQSFLFDEERQSSFSLGIIVFEALILAPHGSTVRYEKKDQDIVPVLGSPDNPTEFLRDVQRGALKFVKGFNAGMVGRNMRTEAAVCSAAFCRLVTEPAAEELKTIGSMDYDDAGYSKMAAPRAAGYYLTHVKELRHDLKHAPWRIGFLYNLFGVRLPYAKLYAFARKKQGKAT